MKVCSLDKQTLFFATQTPRRDLRVWLLSKNLFHFTEQDFTDLIPMGKFCINELSWNSFIAIYRIYMELAIRDSAIVERLAIRDSSIVERLAIRDSAIVERLAIVHFFVLTDFPCTNIVGIRNKEWTRNKEWFCAYQLVPYWEFRLYLLSMCMWVSVWIPFLHLFCCCCCFQSFTCIF